MPRRPPSQREAAPAAPARRPPPPPLGVRRRSPRSLEHALASVVTGLRPPTTLARVQECWGRAAGAAVARECEPVQERGGVVTLRCSSSAWANELELLAPELLERLNGELGEGLAHPPLRGLRFVAGGRSCEAAGR